MPLPVAGDATIVGEPCGGVMVDIFSTLLPTNSKNPFTRRRKGETEGACRAKASVRVNVKLTYGKKVK